MTNRRPSPDNVLVAKCTALLQKGVAVSIVDRVTVKRFNLYFELLAVIGHADPTLGDPPPHLYDAACRWTRRGKRTLPEAWSHVLALDEPLPTLPLWLSKDLVVPLDLEQRLPSRGSAPYWSRPLSAIRNDCDWVIVSRPRSGCRSYQMPRRGWNSSSEPGLANWQQPEGNAGPSSILRPDAPGG